MLKNLIVFLEKEKARGRKYVLLLTVYVYLLITLGLFIAYVFLGVKYDVNITNIYLAVTTLMGTVYGFYTSTAPKYYEKIKEDIEKNNKKINSKKDVEKDV